ncbi:RNA-guided endonuclease InsQ/TnpB family protein [Gloeothece verrucosa]|uniref:Transposase, IS605 OrfB family n=1 Tax=Gloeothece verrucosa (strain PCC 7822) TaxID=497965 RepID=E0UGY9_GLOV7|nr:RNA-guided endonuclease TnpB family protein [Gloeothece verrucosa]ADN15588.1 transposase, IS605 OrfB family [Gloeothece verrucosa PCC 7822]
MYGCQQVLIHPSEEVKAILEFICSQANKLANCAIYYCRQILFKTSRYVGKYEIDEALKSNVNFKAMRSACAQQLLHDVVESFTSYRRLLALWKKGELADKPRVPNYRKKGGMAVVACPSRWIKLIENNQLKIPLGNQVKAWFGIDHFLLPMPTNLNYKDIKEFRIVPRNGCFYLECVYRQKELVEMSPNPNVLGIDHGVDNLLTCTSSTGKSFIIDGKKVKSQNQWYNKRISKIQTGKPQDYWDDELALLTEKRNRQMRDNVNKSARFIINWCLRNNISTIVFGWNKRQKDSINIGRKNNQEFVQIPMAKLKSRIAQLCEPYGIRFVETEESYTSKSSFLDNDLLPTVGEKPDGWQSSGKRVNRGLYRTSNGKLINCDAQAAANIIRKVITQLEVSLAKVTRGVLSLPQRYRLDRLSKSYRKQASWWLQPDEAFRLESSPF